MSEQRLSRHGRNHAATGSDPIPGIGGFLRYDFENIGDYLHIETTAEIKFTVGDYFQVSTGAGGFNFQAAGPGIMGADYWNITSNSAGINLSSASAILLYADADVEMKVGSGQVWEVKDSSGNPKIRWTEGTNDLHIPTGGTIVANL